MKEEEYLMKLSDEDKAQIALGTKSQCAECGSAFDYKKGWIKYVCLHCRFTNLIEDLERAEAIREIKNEKII